MALETEMFKKLLEKLCVKGLALVNKTPEDVWRGLAYDRMLEKELKDLKLKVCCKTTPDSTLEEIRLCILKEVIGTESVMANWTAECDGITFVIDKGYSICIGVDVIPLKDKSNGALLLTPKNDSKFSSTNIGVFKRGNDNDWWGS